MSEPIINQSEEGIIQMSTLLESCKEAWDVSKRRGLLFNLAQGESRSEVVKLGEALGLAKSDIDLVVAVVKAK